MFVNAAQLTTFRVDWGNELLQLAMWYFRNTRGRSEPHVHFLFKTKFAFENVANCYFNINEPGSFSERSSDGVHIHFIRCYIT